VHVLWRRRVAPYVDIELARAKARSGDLDEAIELVRPYARLNQDEMSVFGTAVSVLVESVLRRGGDTAMNEAENAVTDLEAFAAGSEFVVYDVLVLRLRTLIVRAQGYEIACRKLVDRYRATAESFGYEGHIAMAAAM
jgi:ATP/maltotriose-dependent transcriptional regulator MalT